MRGGCGVTPVTCWWMLVPSHRHHKPHCVWLRRTAAMQLYTITLRWPRLLLQLHVGAADVPLARGPILPARSCVPRLLSTESGQRLQGNLKPSETWMSNPKLRPGCEALGELGGVSARRRLGFAAAKALTFERAHWEAWAGMLTEPEDRVPCTHTHTNRGVREKQCRPLWFGGDNSQPHLPQTSRTSLVVAALSLEFQCKVNPFLDLRCLSLSIMLATVVYLASCKPVPPSVQMHCDGSGSRQGELLWDQTHIALSLEWVQPKETPCTKEDPHFPRAPCPCSWLLLPHSILCHQAERGLICCVISVPSLITR